MANPTLHWRMLAPVFVSNPSTSGFLDALYQAGTATTYADGTARTPGTFAAPGTASLPATLGTGSAWTWNFDNTTFATGQKTAIYGYAPTSTAMNQAAIICGTSSTAGAGWKQLATDTRVIGFLYMGLAKNSGTYTSWNNATTPFTVGDFTGLGYTSASVTGGAYAYIIMWESEECIAVQVVNTATGVVSTGMAGAYIDPLSVNPLNAELDGRLYGVAVTGSSNYMGTSWLSSTTIATSPLFFHATTSTDMHSVTFTPGAGTLVSTYRFGNISPSNQFTSRNGDIPQVPLQAWNFAQYIGQFRQIFVTRDSVTGIAWQSGLNPRGYLLGASPSASTDAVLLAY